MIEGVNARLDLYSHLSLEVTLQPRERPRQNSRVDGVDAAPRRREAPTLQLETDERRGGRRARLVDEERVVPFKVASAVTDSGIGYGGTAVEVLPALEASSLPRDPQLAKVALLYRRDGRTGPGEDRIGTRLNAVV